jgi:hypothetical protein
MRSQEKTGPRSRSLDRSSPAYHIATPKLGRCIPRSIFLSKPYGGITSTTRIVVGSTSTTRFCATVYLIPLASGAVASALSGKK